VITDENDVLRDEGEAYGRNLLHAGVEVTVVRYLNTIHEFMSSTRSPKRRPHARHSRRQAPRSAKLSNPATLQTGRASGFGHERLPAMTGGQARGDLRR
jgi:acetyl esterase/lipase